MPDLNIESARWCLSNEYAETIRFGSHNAAYTLTYSRSNPGPYQMNWACDCKGFKFRKTCKHVESAEQERCGYGWEAAAGSPIEMGEKCPKCGGPTRGMSYAV